MILENEDQKTRSYKLLNEYTRMIDIGITKVPRLDQASQTDFSLV
jgi:hypothetical protein